MQPPLPPPAGYQGSFHSIQNCFPYGDCYRSVEQAASGDGLAGEAHGFNPLRPNGYHGLTLGDGLPHASPCLSRAPTTLGPLEVQGLGSLLPSPLPAHQLPIWKSRGLRAPC
eukprot:bmy_15157T0